MDSLAAVDINGGARRSLSHNSQGSDRTFSPGSAGESSPPEQRQAYATSPLDDLSSLADLARVAKQRAADLASTTAKDLGRSALGLPAILEEADHPGANFDDLSNRMSLSLDLSMLLADMLATVVEQMEQMKKQTNVLVSESTRFSATLDTMVATCQNFEDCIREAEEARHGITRLFAEALRAERDARHEQVQEVKKGITDLQNTLPTGGAQPQEGPQVLSDDCQDELSRKVLDMARTEMKEMVDASFRDFQSTALARLASVQEKVQDLAIGTLCTRLSSMEQQLELNRSNIEQVLSPVKVVEPTSQDSPHSTVVIAPPSPKGCPLTPIGITSILASPTAPTSAQSLTVLDNTRRSLQRKGPGSAMRPVKIDSPGLNSARLDSELFFEPQMTDDRIVELKLPVSEETLTLHLGGDSYRMAAEPSSPRNFLTVRGAGSTSASGQPPSLAQSLAAPVYSVNATSGSHRSSLASTPPVSQVSLRQPHTSATRWSSPLSMSTSTSLPGLSPPANRGSSVEAKVAGSSSVRKLASVDSVTSPPILARPQPSPQLSPAGPSPGLFGIQPTSGRNSVPADAGRLYASSGPSLQPRTSISSTTSISSPWTSTRRMLNTDARTTVESSASPEPTTGSASTRRTLSPPRATWKV